MKPSEHCKAEGLKSLKELSELTGHSEQVLIIWHKNNFPLFEIVLKKAAEAEK